MAQFGRLALHTWTVDTTPLRDRARGGARRRLRRGRAAPHRFQALLRDGHVERRRCSISIRAADIPVCTLGCEYGWLFAKGDESTRLFDVLEETCENAVALNCPQIMCAPGQNGGAKQDAIENLKRGADICGKYGLTLAIEFNSQHDGDQLDRGAARNPQRRRAGRMPACCSTPIIWNAAAPAAADLPTSRRRRSLAFQFSDAPAAPVAAGVKRPTDRLPPGQGVVRWNEVLTAARREGLRRPSELRGAQPGAVGALAVRGRARGRRGDARADHQGATCRIVRADRRSTALPEAAIVAQQQQKRIRH